MTPETLKHIMAACVENRSVWGKIRTLPATQRTFVKRWGVNPRTIKGWLDGNQPIPAWVADAAASIAMGLPPVETAEDFDRLRPRAAVAGSSETAIQPVLLR